MSVEQQIQLAQTFRETNPGESARLLSKLFQTGKGLTNDLIDQIVKEAAHLRVEGHYEEAHTVWHAVIDLFPNHIKALTWLTINAEPHEREDMINRWKELLKQSPDNTEIKIGLGDAHSYNFEHKKALKTYEDALRNDEDEQKKPEDISILKTSISHCKECLAIQEEQVKRYARDAVQTAEKKLTYSTQQEEAEKQREIVKKLAMRSGKEAVQAMLEEKRLTHSTRRKNTMTEQLEKVIEPHEWANE